MFLQKLSSKVFYFIFLIAWIFLNPVSLYAQSCHGGGGGQVLAVLSSGQRYQLAHATSYRLTQGRFDPYGRYIEEAPSTSYRSLVTLWGAAYRLSESWQAGLTLPFIYNDYSISTLERSSASLGDPIGEIRYLLWEDLGFLKYRPSVSFYGGIRIPLGKSLAESSDPLGTDVTSDGILTPHLGISLSKIYSPLKLTWDGSFFYPFQKTISKMRGKSIPSYVLKNGNRFQMAQSISYLLNEHVTGSLGIKQMWQRPNLNDVQIVWGSAARLFSTLASLSYAPNTSWGFTLSYDNAFPFYRYLVNQPKTKTFLVAGLYNGF